MPVRDETTTCCIVGGGPAGMMLGLLLARAGVNVTVLEKHADFLRDFRGDTIHPSTIDLIEDLGFLDELEALPHQIARSLRADVNGTWLEVVQLSAVSGRHRCIYLMPQWDFLELLARKAGENPTFRLEKSAPVTDLWKEDGRVVGVVYRQHGETRRLRAALTVACDGRGSTLRQQIGARPFEFGSPMDVLWFHIPRHASDIDHPFGVIRPGRMLVMLNRATYWQAGYLIPKGDYERVRQEGLDQFRARLEEMAPMLGDGRLASIEDWDHHVSMLCVQVNHLERWFYPGLVFLGDAAHAMSPIGGVGINVALQDAVAAANILAEPLLRGRVTMLDLARIQMRRALPAALTQLLQLTIQQRIVRRVLGGQVVKPPAYLQPILQQRYVRRFLAHVLGTGIRPERWRAPRRAQHA